MAEFNETLTKNEKGKGEEKISSFNDSSCQCSCEIELNIFLKSKLGTQYTFQAFNKSINQTPKSSIDVKNLERVKVDLDPCLDKKYMRLQVVEVEEERMGRSESGKETPKNVVMNQSLENVADLSNIDLLKTDFKSCSEYRVELIESTGRIVNKKIPQNSILNLLKAPEVKVDVTGGVTSISIRDVTDGSCAVR